MEIKKSKDEEPIKQIKEVNALSRKQVCDIPIEKEYVSINSFEVGYVYSLPWGLSVHCEPSSIIPPIALRFDNGVDENKEHSGILSESDEALVRDYHEMLKRNIKAVLAWKEKEQ